MSDTRKGMNSQPDWVPSFGMLVVIAVGLIALGYGGAVLVWLSSLGPLGPDN